MKIVKEIDHIEKYGGASWGLGDDGRLYFNYDKPPYNESKGWVSYDDTYFADAPRVSFEGMKQIVDAFWHLRAFI